MTKIWQNLVRPADLRVMSVAPTVSLVSSRLVSLAREDSADKACKQKYNWLGS